MGGHAADGGGRHSRVPGSAEPGNARETRTLDGCLLVLAAAAAVQLVPLPPALRVALSPSSSSIPAALELLPPDPAAWRPLSVAPAATAYATGLLLTALVVFWTARSCSARGMTHRIVRYVAFTGLFAALAAIVLQATSDRSLIYGRWQPLEYRSPSIRSIREPESLRDVGIDGIAAGDGLHGRRAPPYESSAERGCEDGFRVRTARHESGLGRRVRNGGMILALLISTSRSGLVALAASLVAGAWLARHRLAHAGRWCSASWPRWRSRRSSWRTSTCSRCALVSKRR